MSELYKRKFVLAFYDVEDEYLLHVFDNPKSILTYLKKPVTKSSCHDMSVNLFRILRSEDNLTYLLGSPMRLHKIDISDNLNEEMTNAVRTCIRNVLTLDEPFYKDVLPMKSNGDLFDLIDFLRSIMNDRSKFCQLIDNVMSWIVDEYCLQYSRKKVTSLVTNIFRSDIESVALEVLDE